MRQKKKKKSRFWGVFIIAVHRALCWVWGGGGIAVLWSCQRVVRCVTVFACFSSSSLLRKKRRRRHGRAPLAGVEDYVGYYVGATRAAGGDV